MVGIGVSTNSNSGEAGREGASIAVKAMAGTEPAFAVAFCGGQHDPGKILEGIRSELGPIHIVGGAAVGTITNTALGYTGFESAVAVFPSSLDRPVIVTANGLDQGDRETGRELGHKIRSTAKEGSTVILFYDSIKSGPPPVLHVGSQLIEGLYEGLSGFPATIVGAGTVGDFAMTQSFIFDGNNPAKHSAVAAVLPPSVTSRTVTMHGCIPISSFYEITRIEGQVLYELDGRPALDVIRAITGEDLPADHPSLTVTVGEKHGDPFAPYDESSYINRLIITGNPENGSVVLFEADFKVGTKVQIMSRDATRMMESVQKRANAFLSSCGSNRPLWALYIDCAGRSCAFSGGETEEASLVQAAVGQDIPLLGIYSGVEIAPLLGRSRPLDWTGVLTVFTEE